MRSKKKFTKKYVILNSFQYLISRRPCDPKSNSRRRVGAFTLAEILITLGIIGIIANMTIPQLVADSQKRQYTTGLEKAYTEFNQALIQIASDSGCIGDLACTGIFDPSTTQESLGNELVKYFKLAKNCESNNGGPTIYGCMSNNTSANYDGTSARQNYYDVPFFYRFITSGGVSFMTGNWKKNCTDSLSTGVTNNMTQVCAEMYVDVNGFKKPNNVGRDIFHFYITNGKGPLLYPSGGADDNNNSPWIDSSGSPRSCYSGDAYGDYCAGRVIEEGWQMKY